MPTDSYVKAKLDTAKKVLAHANAFEASVTGHSSTPHHAVPLPAPAAPSSNSDGVAESLKYNRDNVNQYLASQKPNE